MAYEVEGRLIVQARENTGEEAEKNLDITVILADLGGVLIDRFTLAADASAQAVVLPSACMVAIVSRRTPDTPARPFSYRTRTGETQITNARAVLFVGNDGETQTLAAGSVVLDGNGSNEAEIEVWAVRAGS